MLTRLEKKIQFIREQPEPVRMRYLFLCLCVAMFFIVIIWLFSLQESVSEIAKTKVVLPQTNIQNDAKSLQSLLNKDLPLQIKNNVSGDEGSPLEAQVKENNNDSVIKNQ